MSVYLNADCMNPETGLPSYPDKYFDLAIVDPPYGIGAENHAGNKENGWTQWQRKEWDCEPPNQSYFRELERVSKNQIIWGANYFDHGMKPSMGWIFWDKMQRDFSMAHGELAYTSFDVALRVFEHARGNEKGFAPKLKDHEKHGIALHPTQKPMALYRWLIKNYAKQGDKILDTHVGSASSLVVYEEMGFEYVGYELDADYYRDSCKRLEAFRSQPKLFTGKEIFEASAPTQKSLFE